MINITHVFKIQKSNIREEERQYHVNHWAECRQGIVQAKNEPMFSDSFEELPGTLAEETGTAVVGLLVQDIPHMFNRIQIWGTGWPVHVVDGAAAGSH